MKAYYQPPHLYTCQAQLPDLESYTAQSAATFVSSEEQRHQAAHGTSHSGLCSRKEEALNPQADDFYHK